MVLEARFIILSSAMAWCYRRLRRCRASALDELLLDRRQQEPDSERAREVSLEHHRTRWVFTHTLRTSTIDEASESRETEAPTTLAIESIRARERERGACMRERWRAIERLIDRERASFRTATIIFGTENFRSAAKARSSETQTPTSCAVSASSIDLSRSISVDRFAFLRHLSTLSIARTHSRAISIPPTSRLQPLLSISRHSLLLSCHRVSLLLSSDRAAVPTNTRIFISLTCPTRRWIDPSARRYG